MSSYRAPVFESSARDGEHFASDARRWVDYGLATLRDLNPQPGERILDLGCGDGSLTELIAAAGAEVVGVDIDRDMVELARARGIDARVMDGAALTFSREFDAVFSNGSLHYMEPRKTLDGVARALKDGGRFAAELGAHGCVGAATTAMVAVLNRYKIDGAALVPWRFPTADEYCEMLEDAGFTVETIEVFHRQATMPNGPKRWLEVIGKWFLNALPESERSAAGDEVASLLGLTLRTSRGQWIEDYTHIRVKARLVST
jgi:SAM-dependent methyltransferase